MPGFETIPYNDLPALEVHQGGYGTWLIATGNYFELMITCSICELKIHQ
jgi:hypothetical protein